MSVKSDQLAKIAEAKQKVLALQAVIASSGMSAADEAEVDAALAALSVTADPTVQNPPGTPPDPGLPV